MIFPYQLVQLLLNTDKHFTTLTEDLQKSLNSFDCMFKDSNKYSNKSAKN